MLIMVEKGERVRFTAQQFLEFSLMVAAVVVVGCVTAYVAWQILPILIGVGIGAGAVLSWQRMRNGPSDPIV